MQRAVCLFSVVFFHRKQIDFIGADAKAIIVAEREKQWNKWDGFPRSMGLHLHSRLRCSSLYQLAHSASAASVAKRNECEVQSSGIQSCSCKTVFSEILKAAAVHAMCKSSHWFLHWNHGLTEKGGDSWREKLSLSTGNEPCPETKLSIPHFHTAYCQASTGSGREMIWFAFETCVNRVMMNIKNKAALLNLGCSLPGPFFTLKQAGVRWTRSLTLFRTLTIKSEAKIKCLIFHSSRTL